MWERSLGSLGLLVFVNFISGYELRSVSWRRGGGSRYPLNGGINTQGRRSLHIKKKKKNIEFNGKYSEA